MQIVASTNVYGDIASAIAGDLAEVTTIITNSAQDPHSYEASARDQLALSHADLVIENGGGYDPFMDTLLAGSEKAAVPVVNASEASELVNEGGEGRAQDHIEGFDEHVWYSFQAVDRIARALADELGELDEDNADTYEENYVAFAVEIGALGGRARELAALTTGKTAAVTEPVPLYLLEEIGLQNITPHEFSEAIEEGTDVPPSVLQEVFDVFSDGSVALLACSEQTAGPATEQVREAAESADVAVVNLTETLPEGTDYITWMESNIDALEAALR